MRRDSEITVKNILDKSIGLILVFYNGNKIFEVDKNSEWEGWSDIIVDNTFEFNNKKVFSYEVKIVDGHYSVISIIGE